MKTVLLDGEYRVAIVEESMDYVLTGALEDILFKSLDHRLEMMHAGRRYWFCRCCFEKRIQRKVSG
jgi:hypothetical protein